MEPVSILIEPLASLSDLDAVLEIEAASFTSPWTRDMYLAELENVGVSFCYLARNDAKTVVGFCSFWRVVEELHINNLAVAPPYRRLGIGTALLQHVLGEGARLGARRATLEVRRSNEAARQLYAQFGVPTTRIPSRMHSCCGATGSSDLASPRTLCYGFYRHWDRHAAARVDPSESETRSRRRSMNGQGQSLKELLLQTDEEFHTLVDKHHQLEDRLHELTEKHYLSQPEQLEEVNLKKQKLQLKDRMEDILRRHKQTHGESSVRG
jgi:ribosomal-protein-alanine N-acetyltransferase